MASPWSAKPDMRHYRVLRRQEDFSEWWQDTRATARAQCIRELFDPYYRPPTDPVSTATFERKQAWACALLRKILQTNEGQSILRDHRDDYNAQTVLAKVYHHATRSTHATLDSSAIMGRLTTAKLDSTWPKTAVEFINAFTALITQYNDQQPDRGALLRQGMARVLLQTAVSPVSVLNDVKNRDHERIAQGQPPLDYVAYLQLLKNTATAYDQRRALTSRRRNNEHDLAYYDDPPAVTTLAIANTNVNRNRPRLNRATWDNLNPEDQTAWDTLSDAA